MRAAERILSRSRPVGGLGFVTFDQVMTFFDKVIIPAFGAASQFYLGLSSLELKEEALKLQKSELEAQKAQALLEFSLVKQQYEDSLRMQEEAQSNLLGVPYGNVILLGAGLIVLMLIMASKRR
jgi:hypothetical protein